MRHAQAGFTLVELVITISLTTIVVSFMAVFISDPVGAYADQGRRAELVDLAENSLRRIARDIRAALPNSIRVASSGSIVALELLNTVDGVAAETGDAEERFHQQAAHEKQRQYHHHAGQDGY